MIYLLLSLMSSYSCMKRCLEVAQLEYLSKVVRSIFFPAYCIILSGQVSSENKRTLNSVSKGTIFGDFRFPFSRITHREKDKWTKVQINLLSYI